MSYNLYVTSNGVTHRGLVSEHIHGDVFSVDVISASNGKIPDDPLSLSVPGHRTGDEIEFVREGDELFFIGGRDEAQ